MDGARLMADDHSDSGMLALVPADPGKLAIDGGLPADTLHCTLVFLGDGVKGWSEDRVTALRALAQELSTTGPAIEARVFSHSVWNRDRAPNPQGELTKPCLVYELRADDDRILMLARQGSRRAEQVLGVDFPQQWVPYTPHIAAAYDQDDPSKLATSPGPVRLATLRLAIGDQVFDYPLTGSVALAHDGGEMATKTKAKPAGRVTRTGDTKVTVDKETGELQLHWPCLVIEGMKTGDGRFIPYGSLGHRGLPLPVMGQTKTGDGHKGAEVFGRITKLERVEGPSVTSKETGEPFPEGTAVWQAWGVGDPESEPGKLALSGYLTGNSADLADTKTVEELGEEDGQAVVELRGGNIAGTTLVPVPAFADGYVEVDGQVVDREPATEALVAAAEPAPLYRIIDDEPTTAAAEPDEDEPFRPPLRLFEPRQLRSITPLTVEPQPDGTIAVFGHVADFNRPHISFTGRRVLARPSPSGYRKGFNTGAVRVLDDEGVERTVAVGRLTIGDGHADLSLNARDAKAVYDDPDKAWAWVQASDDSFGIQVNGVVIPGTPDSRVTQALAHPVSGDWRPIDGHRELVAACCVNTQGIPVARELVASGQELALVAAGAVAPAPDNPAVLGRTVAEVAMDQLTQQLPELLRGLIDGLRPSPEPDMADEYAAALAELETPELLAELGVTRFDPESLTDDEVSALIEQFGKDPERVKITLTQDEHDGPGELVADIGMIRSETLANWVEKAGGLPPYIKRIARHLQQKGKDESQAIATAVNVVKKMCATGDINFPGKQQVNAGSQAEACAAVKSWEAKKARS
jgi:hypothetical protein